MSEPPTAEAWEFAAYGMSMMAALVLLLLLIERLL
jgi:hypothetical protein